MKKIKRIEAPVWNHYGGPAVWRLDGKYFLGMENWDGWRDGVQISKEFFDMWVKEFAAQEGK